MSPQRLINANALNRKDINCANVPMNFIDTAPTILTIPDNPTNGDMIKALFPTKTFIQEDSEVGDNDTVFDLSWWNAPYKGEAKCNKQLTSNGF